MDLKRLGTRIVLISGIVLMLAYETIALLHSGTTLTISQIVWQSSKSYPLVPFMFGLLMGHLFWQGKK